VIWLAILAHAFVCVCCYFIGWSAGWNARMKSDADMAAEAAKPTQPDPTP
jgi:hypothetical protein